MKEADSLNNTETQALNIPVVSTSFDDWYENEQPKKMHATHRKIVESHRKIVESPESCIVTGKQKRNS